MKRKTIKANNIGFGVKIVGYDGYVVKKIPSQNGETIEFELSTGEFAGDYTPNFDVPVE